VSDAGFCNRKRTFLTCILSATYCYSVLRLTVLGSGDAFNAGGALHSAYQLEHEGGTLLIECGPSILAGMKREGISTDAPDGVLISHLHGDHFAGLPFLFLEYVFENPRSRPLLIAGPPTTKDRFHDVYAAMYQETVFRDVGFEVTHIDANPGERFEIAGFEIEPFLVPHPAKPFSLGYRIESPEGVLVFSGDSAWTDDFVAQTQGADVFLCECCSMRQGSDMHVSYEEILAHKDKLGCRRLLLTHLGSDVVGCEDLEIEMVHDGLVVEFGNESD
jgi:ribonuclease BN (tRNA processing enzyme)